jgi:hypothetical protein
MDSTQHINLEFMRSASYAPELVKSYDHNVPSELNSPGVEVSSEIQFHPPIIPHWFSLKCRRFLKFASPTSNLLKLMNCRDSDFGRRQRVL